MATFPILYLCACSLYLTESDKVPLPYTRLAGSSAYIHLSTQQGWWYVVSKPVGVAACSPSPLPSPKRYNNFDALRYADSEPQDSWGCLLHTCTRLHKHASGGHDHGWPRRASCHGPMVALGLFFVVSSASSSGYVPYHVLGGKEAQIRKGRSLAGGPCRNFQLFSFPRLRAFPV